jgi:hypothetical protein
MAAIRWKARMSMSAYIVQAKGGATIGVLCGAVNTAGVADSVFKPALSIPLIPAKAGIQFLAIAE